MERLKQRVASSSSRVIASLQQAATGTFQQQQQQQMQTQTQAPVQAQQPLAGPARQTKPEEMQQQTAPEQVGSSSASLLADLTEKERQILLEVFKKEEQFQRDTISQMAAARTLQAARPEQGRDQQQLSLQSQTSGHSQAAASLAGQAASVTPRQSISKQQQQQQASQGSPASAGSSLASARSNTPPSRPSSSIFGTTTFGRKQQQQQQQSRSHSQQQHRTQSSCSSASTNLDPLGQCRICRKSILSNETCHLCSNCNQFICEDCASYSAAEQHWMCSSCRRRTTKPAIPADALRELGLNQDSNAVRRMTLRLNQNELKLALGKSSSESANSSGSSSGCSSMPGSANQASFGTSKALKSVREARSRAQEQQHLQMQMQMQKQRSQPYEETRAPPQAQAQAQANLPATLADAAGSWARSSNSNSANSAAKQTACQPTSERRASLIQRPAAAAAATKPPPDTRDPSHQPGWPAECRGGSPGQPDPRDPSEAPQRRAGQPVGGGRPLGKLASTVAPPADGQSPACELGAGRGRARNGQQARRASIAMLEGQQGSRKASALVGARKQSVANFQRLQLEQQAYGQQVWFNACSNQQQLMRPQTMVTASSDASMAGSQNELLSMGLARRDSQHPANATLIPIPPDQIHLRRLSDQSNLVRRSSIIADTIDGLSMARNRSHSNIDSVGYSNYFYQSPLLVQRQQQQTDSQQSLQSVQNFAYQPALNPFGQQGASLGLAPLSGQQCRASEQWEQQNLAGGQQQQQAAVYAGNHDFQNNANQKQHFASIITSYTQKQVHSPDGVHSDSSSDIEEDARVAQVGYEFENEQPNGLFAPPRPPSATIDFLSQQHQHGVHLDPRQNLGQIAIPSVSVSEFSSSQRRHSIQRQQSQHYDQIMTTPMQINVAIEQAIQQQQMQQQQQQHQGSLLAGDQAHLAPRRGSSGRVLPKIPGEQSRSLLDLPHNNVANGAGQAGDQQSSMLDLPMLSPTIRRASAPEGQNITIVVDDMDNSMRVSSGGKQSRTVYGKSGELFERLVLCRDDSLDPSTNLARGFGLHVIGGKIDEQGKLQACVMWTLPGGPADKVGLKRGDKIIEWDGKCLVNMSYEQVAEIIDSSANIAELLVKPVRKLEPQPGANFVRSQRRLSQQTERDMRKMQEPKLGAMMLKNDSRRDWSQSSDLGRDGQRQQQQQRQVAGGQTNAAMGSSNDLSYCARSGTGRRLPQIPGFMVDGNLGQPVDLVAIKQTSGSTSQLDHSSRQYNGYGPDSNHLSALHDQQQSRSAGELYGPQSGHLAASYNEGPIMGATARAGQWQSRPFEQTANYQPNGHQNQWQNFLANQAEIRGLIGLQVNVDERMNQLEISVLSAINIDRDLSQDYYVRVKILPESDRFKPCMTQPSSDMNWKETFIFQNFPVQQVHKMALEIGIWVYDDAPRLSTQIAQPTCEALIPIQSARERNTDFWPLRPPPTSPQTRRRSLNDLIQTHSSQTNMAPNGFHQQIGYQIASAQTNWYQKQPDLAQQAIQGTLNEQQLHVHEGHQTVGLFAAEPSLSDRNLPESSKLRTKPRRASDEVAGSSSQKLSARVSPAASRRSISVMNVGDEQTILRRSSQTPGSQSNLLKAQLRRDSASQTQGNGSFASKPSPASGGVSRQVVDGQAFGVTPSGRRSSLAGIHSMSGYRSQKNSQSDTADQDSPMGSTTGLRRSQQVTPQHSTLLSGTNESAKYRAQQRASVVSVTPPQVGAEAGGSRRGSTDQQPQLQRKGSFAMALRKLKRTMSLTKSSDQEAFSNLSSRRTSSNSTLSSSELPEDLGVTPRIAAHTDIVGRLRLSFMLTKGQLEVEVISAQKLKFDCDNSFGLYVKMYLKSKNRTNKRKTRVVQPWDSPIFKQTIKYDGSLVDNKSLEVSVWQKQSGLRGKQPIGFTEIRLSELNLGQLQTSWYNLHSMEIDCGSSVED